MPSRAFSKTCCSVSRTSMPNKLAFAAASVGQCALELSGSLLSHRANREARPPIAPEAMVSFDACTSRASGSCKSG